MNVEVIIEKNENVLYGRIDGNEYFSPVTAAETKKDVLDNLKMLIKDFQEHEGKEDKFWGKIAVETTTFDIQYNFQPNSLMLNKINLVKVPL